MIHRNFYFLFFIFLVLLGSSCSRAIYEVSTLESNNVKMKSGNFCYEDSMVTICYNFWSRGGNLSYTIHNKTSNVMLIHWRECRLTFNGEAIPYDTSDIGNKDWIIAGGSKSYQFFELNQSFTKTKKYPAAKTAAPIPVPSPDYVQLSNKMCFGFGNDSMIHRTDNRFVLSNSNYYSYKGMAHLSDSTMQKSFYASHFIHQKTQAVLSLAALAGFLFLLGYFGG